MIRWSIAYDNTPNNPIHPIDISILKLYWQQVLVPIGLRLRAASLWCTVTRFDFRRRIRSWGPPRWHPQGKLPGRILQEQSDTEEILSIEMKAIVMMSVFYKFGICKVFSMQIASVPQ